MIFWEKNMNERDFCYWLQGYVELSKMDTFGQEQVQIIKDHLDLVFKKVTPTYDDDTLERLNRELSPAYVDYTIIQSTC